MRLLVLGATGRTGAAIVAQALDAGHDVRVLVREPAHLASQHAERVEVRVGDVTDADVVDDAVGGCQAVLSALGVSSPRALLGTTLMRDTIAALLPAMERRGVPRLVVLSALGVGASRDAASTPLRLAFGTALRQVGADKAASEELIRRSELAWTIVYPPALTDGARTGRFATADERVRGVPRISRADVAAFMLAQLSDAAFVRRDAVLVPSAGSGGAP
jgi:putative NADH-flavin reductase